MEIFHVRGGKSSFATKRFAWFFFGNIKHFLIEYLIWRSFGPNDSERYFKNSKLSWKNASFVVFSDQLSLPFKSMHEILKYSEEFFKKQTIKVKSISKQSWNIPKHSSKFTVHRIEIKYLRFCWIESQQLHHICVCARINLKELATHAHIFLTISCCLRQWKCKNYICSFSCDLFHSLFSNNACEYYIWGISFISPSLAYLSTLFERVIK